MKHDYRTTTLTIEYPKQNGCRGKEKSKDFSFLFFEVAKQKKFQWSSPKENIELLSTFERGERKRERIK